MRRTLLAAATAALCFAGCKTAEPTPDTASTAKADEQTAPAPQPAAPAKLTIDTSKPMPPGLDEAAMDTSIDPCDDFYQYACGGWMKTTEIPADRAAWSRGFTTVAERNEKILNDLLTQTADNEAPKGTPYAKQLGDFYATCMDEPKLENGLAELKKEAAVRIDKVKDAKSLSAAIAWMHSHGMAPLFSFGSTPDLKKPDFVIAEFAQGGLGLPDRDYYTETKNKEILDNYRAHVAKMFELYGQKPEQAKKSADEVLDLETKLAQASLTRVEQRDPNRLYNKIDRKGLVAASPDFNWALFLTDVGAGKIEQINVTHPPFFGVVSNLTKEVKPAQWRTYLTWQLIHGSVPALPKRFQDEHFAFMSKNLTGAKQDLPRWKKCVAYTDEALGEALAVPFVEKYFGADGKQVTSDMVKGIEQAFEKDLEQISWMDATTKDRARAKLKAITNKIGYPEKWKQYDSMKTDRSSFLHNWLAAGAWQSNYDVNKIAKPVDKTEWEMTPPTVNAYYNPPLNEIVFPAGILQPPFFDIKATDPVNFGAMGMVVGHETTHGFDDEGRQFGADGSLTDWWTQASADAFKQKAECVKNRYDSEVAVDDLHVNGALTMGENIADFGGTKLAFMAMRNWQASHPESAEKTKQYRFDDAQQFFLGYAQSWCSKYRPENARMRVMTDPHSPPFLRVNVPLSNLPEFQQAFQCKDGAKMARTGDQRCTVW